MAQQKAIEELLAKQEIQEALARYARGVDRGDVELVRSAYHEDATDDHGYTVVETGWDLADLADRDNPNGFPKEWTSSSHMITNVLIEVDGDRAESESYYFATMRFEHEGTTYRLVAEGRYVDHWERRDGGTFKITDRIVVTDGLRTDATDGTWPGPDTDVPKGFYGGPTWPVGDAIWGTRSEDDVSYRILRGVGTAARS